MTLSLQTIEELAWGPERSSIEIALTSGESVTLELSDTTGPLEDNWIWLQQSFQTGKPIALNAAAQDVLPSTVVLSVELAVPEGDGNVRVSGPPRPAFMQLDRSAPFAKEVLNVLQDAAASGAPAVLALRDGIWIEDVKILSEEEANRLLGFPSP